MRKILTVKKYMTIGRLRCKRCGKKQSFNFYGYNKINAYWPSEGINGWYLKNTELCPTCYIQTHAKIRK